MKLIGSKAFIFFDTLEPSKVLAGTGSNSTSAKTKYFVMARGTGSHLPIGVGGIFQSPITGTQITLVAGDKVQPLDPQRFCKTSADISVEQGTIDVGDDCNPGESILDGITKASGSFSGFMQEDMDTGEFTDITMEILSRFFDVIYDDAAGIYQYTPATSDPLFLMLNLNSASKVGQMEKWLFMPIILPSFSSSFGMTDAQNMDLSWNQGEGKAILYVVPHAA